MCHEISLFSHWVGKALWMVGLIQKSRIFLRGPPFNLEKLTNFKIGGIRMRYAPERIFILENGQYIEIDYQRFELMMKQQNDKRYFIPLHGMLMEVNEQQYYEFYKDKRRHKYLKEESLKNGEISYDMLTADEFKREIILVDSELSVEQLAERNIIRDQLYNSLELLTLEERELIHAMFFEGVTEREYARRKGVYSNAVHKKKKRIVAKLRDLMNNNISK